MRPIVLVPPASPGNFGDLAAVVATRRLFWARKIVILDLFSRLDPGLPNWSHYSDLETVTLENLESVRAEALVFLAQDTLDGRYGEFHIERLWQSIEILDSSSPGRGLPVAIWNVTAEKQAQMGMSAQRLLSRASQIIVRDKPGLNWLSSSGFQADVAPDLASIGISRALKLQKGATSIGTVDVVSLGWHALEHFEELKQFLQDEIRPNILQMFILDERFYKHQPSDVEVSLRLLSKLDMNCWVNIHSLSVTEKTSTNSHLCNMVASISGGKSFTTSRHHASLGRLLSGRSVNVVAYNSKFAALHDFGINLHRNTGKVLDRISPTSRFNLPDFNRVWKTATKSFLASASGE